MMNCNRPCKVRLDANPAVHGRVLRPRSRVLRQRSGVQLDVRDRPLAEGKSWPGASVRQRGLKLPSSLGCCRNDCPAGRHGQAARIAARSDVGLLRDLQSVVCLDPRCLAAGAVVPPAQPELDGSSAAFHLKLTRDMPSARGRSRTSNCTPERWRGADSAVWPGWRQEVHLAWSMAIHHGPRPDLAARNAAWCPSIPETPSRRSWDLRTGTRSRTVIAVLRGSTPRTSRFLWKLLPSSFTHCERCAQFSADGVHGQITGRQRHFEQRAVPRWSSSPARSCSRLRRAG